MRKRCRRSLLSAPRSLGSLFTSWHQTHTDKSPIHFFYNIQSKKPALRTLAKQLLNVTIQEGEHSSVSAPLSINQQWKSEVLRNRAKRDISKTGYFPHPLSPAPPPLTKTKKSNVTLRTRRVQTDKLFWGTFPWEVGDQN